MARAWSQAYEFLCVPENFPLWASGLSSGIERLGDAWLAQGPDGPIRIRFSPRNEYGVLDHDVIAADGRVTHNPLRVVPNGAGCEVTFMLFRTPGMSEESFSADAAWVGRDLAALKDLLER